MAVEDKLHTLLCGLILFSGDGKKSILDVLGRLKTDFKILDLSSIYQVFANHEHLKSVHDIITKDSFMALSCVFKANTRFSPHECMKKLMELESYMYKKEGFRSLSLNLLIYDGETKMTPNLTVPYPDLHQRPEILIPAAEVWGEYKHPILNTNLSQMTSQFSGEHWGSFFAQGKSILKEL